MLSWSKHAFYPDWAPSPDKTTWESVRQMQLYTRQPCMYTSPSHSLLLDTTTLNPEPNPVTPLGLVLSPSNHTGLLQEHSPHRIAPSRKQLSVPARSWWLAPSPLARSVSCVAAHALQLPWGSPHHCHHPTHKR